MTDQPYQRCTRCIMDTTDPTISFDADGVCNHCHHFDTVAKTLWFPNETGAKKLSQIVEKIKAEGKDREYDCILGLSGGVDSSYLALVSKEYGLRPLVVHVDAGWNSELAVHNIEQIVKYCDYDLHTHVMEWEEMRDLQVAYLKAGIMNQDVPQDHAFFASLYRFAVSNKIKYVINGSNVATESILPPVWSNSAMDAINLRAIHKAYGTVPLRQYKTIGFLSYFFYYPFVKGMTVVSPLNYTDYNKKDALQTLKDKVGYKEYGRKHGESRFTKFHQNYYLPTKFGIDKRIAHLSSRVLSGDITRDEALAELREPLYNPDELADDLSYVAKKLGLTVEELTALAQPPGRQYYEFANWDKYYKLMRSVRAGLEKIMGVKVRTYSS